MRREEAEDLPDCVAGEDVEQPCEDEVQTRDLRLAGEVI